MRQKSKVDVEAALARYHAEQTQQARQRMIAATALLCTLAAILLAAGV